MERRGGFTLVELMFGCVIAVGLLGWGIPTFRDIARDSARTGEVNQFLQAVYLARSEAIKRNGVASLCPSLDGNVCGPVGSPWHGGWIVFANHDRDNPAVRDPGEDLLHVYPAWPDGEVFANRSTLSFRPYGQAVITATFTFCDARGSRAARAVIISQTGRPRVSDRDSSGGALSCG